MAIKLSAINSSTNNNGNAVEVARQALSAQQQVSSTNGSASQASTTKTLHPVAPGTRLTLSEEARRLSNLVRVAANHANMLVNGQNGTLRSATANSANTSSSQAIASKSTSASTSATNNNQSSTGGSSSSQSTIREYPSIGDLSPMNTIIDLYQWASGSSTSPGVGYLMNMTI